MKKHQLNWFEKYSLRIINEYGGIKNLLVGALGSFGMFGFVPNFSHKGVLSLFYNSNCKGV